MDCGDGEIVTLSVFRDADQAEASREFAQRWTEENLHGLEFRRVEALRGEILVSRAARDMLEPGHSDRPGSSPACGATGFGAARSES